MADEKLKDGIRIPLPTYEIGLTDKCNMACKYDLAEGTKVLMADFTEKPIEEVKAGNRIIAFNELTGNDKKQRKLLYSVVQEAGFTRELTEAYKYILEDGTEVVASGEHPFLTGRNKFLTTEKFYNSKAKEKKVYQVINEKSFKRVPVKIEKINIPPTKFYNLTTECHTFIANKVFVHNCFEKNKGKCSMKAEEIKDVLENPLTNGLYIFGGEPLMNMDFLKEADEIINDADYSKATKNNLLRGLRRQTSNGTLIKDNIDDIKKLELSFQLSIDGPKEIHDKERVFCNGKGSFDKAMEGYNLLKENGVQTYFHGVISKKNVPHTFEILKFFYEADKERFGDKEEAIDNLFQNHFMFVIEDDYDDEDIDEVINQYDKFITWLKDEELNGNVSLYRKAVKSLCNKVGTPCSAGSAMLILDTNGKLYPCHRVSHNPEIRDKECLGSSFTDEPENLEILNGYHDNRLYHNRTYSLFGRFKDWNKLIMNIQLCPATQYDCSGSLFYSPPKYVIFCYELTRYLLYKAEEVGVTLQELESERENYNYGKKFGTNVRRAENTI